MMYQGECSLEKLSVAGNAFNQNTAFFTRCVKTSLGMREYGNMRYVLLTDP